LLIICLQEQLEITAAFIPLHLQTPPPIIYVQSIYTSLGANPTPIYPLKLYKMFPSDKPQLYLYELHSLLGLGHSKLKACFASEKIFKR
jgi:hypothetical protein